MSSGNIDLELHTRADGLIVGTVTVPEFGGPVTVRPLVPERCKAMVELAQGDVELLQALYVMDCVDGPAWANTTAKQLLSNKRSVVLRLFTVIHTVTAETANHNPDYLAAYRKYISPLSQA